MDKDKQKNNTIIIKRIKKIAHKHHGGAWKIAYADFVTAMMSFFLLMWLISMLNKYQLQGISEYFKKPLKEVFTKQDNVARTNTMKPDTDGPTTFSNTGLKDNVKDSPDKNTGKSEENQKKESQNSESNKIDIKTDPGLKEMVALQKNLENKLNNDPQMKEFKNQLNFVITSDGLKIVINELKDKPMFSVGKVDFEKYAVTILDWLGKQINTYSNKMMIIGHTDNLKYPSNSNYGNWELSVDRANATRRILIKNGIKEDKFLRIIGDGDVNTLETLSGNHPANRRIDIIMLTNDATKRILSE